MNSNRFRFQEGEDMFDLNSIMFYKAKFSISPTEPNCDLLWKVVLHIHAWQTHKWNYKNSNLLDSDLKIWTELKNGGRIFSKDSNNTVYIESEYFAPSSNKSQYWACKIVEKRAPKQGYCLRQWTTEIGFEKLEDSSAIFSCVVSYSDVPGFIGPCEERPSPTLPKIIRMLMSDDSIHCFYGVDPLVAEAQHLGNGDFPSFWTKLLNPNREIPYIYISPKRKEYGSEETIQIIDPQRLADSVCANAIVYYSDSLDFSREMSYLCNENYGCYSGAVRVYMPHMIINDQNDQYRHRFLTAAYIAESGLDFIIQIFRKALAQNVNFYDSFFRISDCKEMREEYKRQERLAQLRMHHKEEINKIQDIKLDEAINEEQKRLEVESHIKALNDELSQEKEKNYNLSSQIENLRAAADRCNDLENSLKNRFAIKKLPENSSDVVGYFTNMFSDRIAFTSDAIKSLKDCSLQSQDLWKVLFYLSTLMRDFMMNGISDPFGEFRNKTGINCARGEGSMTRKNKKLMTQFQTEYGGNLINIEPHITFPQEKQSIHFGFDEKSQKIIVGHCGNHLKIYSSLKVH